MSDQTPDTPHDDAPTPQPAAPVPPYVPAPGSDAPRREMTWIILACLVIAVLVVGGAVAGMYFVNQRRAAAQLEESYDAAQAHMAIALSQLKTAQAAKETVDNVQADDAAKVLADAEKTISEASQKAQTELNLAEKDAKDMPPSSGRARYLAAIALTKASALMYAQGASGLSKAAPAFPLSESAKVADEKAGAALDACIAALNKRSWSAAARDAATTNSQADAAVRDLVKLGAIEKQIYGSPIFANEALKSARLVQKAARICRQSAADGQAGRVASFNRNVKAYNDVKDEMALAATAADLISDPKEFISENRVTFGDAGRGLSDATETYETACKQLEAEMGR